MRISHLLIALALFGCEPKKDNSSSQPEVDSTSAEVIKPADIQYDYNTLYGIYDHESTTKGFSAAVSIQQEGLNLHFILSVSQGSCKAETEGSITMVEHNKNYYTGFYNFDKCPLQFTFYPAEQKVDIKEVSLCTTHSGGCNYEGMYSKRKN